MIGTDQGIKSPVGCISSLHRERLFIYREMFKIINMCFCVVSVLVSD